MQFEQKQSLIIGLGNDWLTDDGIGVIVAEKIKNDYPKLTQQFDFKTSVFGGLELIDLITGYDEVYFIDGIITLEVKPGFIWNFTPENFRETLHLSHYHDVKFTTLFDFMRQIGLKTPEHVKVFAIEVVEDKEFSKEPSLSVQHQLDEICKNILYNIVGGSD